MKAPRLDLDWEVGLFRAVSALWRRARPRPVAYDLTRAAHLAGHIVALQPLAQLVSGEALQLKPARSEGGIRGRDLLLPVALDVFPTPEANRDLYVLRVVLAASLHNGLRGRRPPADPVLREEAVLQAVVHTVAGLRRELPAFGAAWDAAAATLLQMRPDPATLGSRGRAWELGRQAALRGETLPLGADAHAAERGLSSPGVALWGDWWLPDVDDQTQGGGDDVDPTLPDGTERPAPPVDDVRRVLLDPKEQEEKVLQHTFEKVETLDSFDGNVQPDDGSDDLDEQLEALEEVDLRDLIRGGEPAHSIYKADLSLGSDIPDVETILPGECGIPYDEWDHRAGAYRVGWCTVYPSAVNAKSDDWHVEPLARHRTLVQRLRRLLEDRRSRLEACNRQRDGEQPDLDALVDRYSELRAGRTGDDRLYIRAERRRRSVATTVLLDLSLSSDAWINNRRVLDVSRESTLVLGEVASALGDALQVLAFASSTRNRCRVWMVKDWHDNWPVGRARLGALEPQGYTRIGPAIRHATAELRAAPADQRLLLLVSDGKPNDYDRYEGPHGISDVRRALREAEGVGVVAHVLTIDTAASAFLPSMFGAGRWHVVPSPDQLLSALTEVYGRLTSR